MKSDFENNTGLMNAGRQKKSIFGKKLAAQEEGAEIKIISSSVNKIAFLLAVGYGEAGTNIIVKNLKKKKGVSVEIPGEKVLGVYGFCDIRNFTDATEVL